MATNDYEKATLFNNYFRSVFNSSTFTLPPEDLMPIGSPDCLELSITEEDVFDALSSLDPSKAMGMDNIGPKVLCTCNLSAALPPVSNMPPHAYYTKQMENSLHYAYP